MKVKIFGKNISEVEGLVKKAGFSIDLDNPDYIVTYGGDGTLMHAEALFPGIPKIILKNSLICKKCSVFSNEEVLERVKNGKE